MYQYSYQRAPCPSCIKAWFPPTLKVTANKLQKIKISFPLPGESSSSSIAVEDETTTEMLKISHAMFTLVNLPILLSAVHTFNAETRHGEVKSVKRTWNRKLLPEQVWRWKREILGKGKRCVKAAHFLLFDKTIFLFPPCMHTTLRFHKTPTQSNV